MKNTAKIYTEFNTLLLSQYTYHNRPKLKAEYHKSYGGKLNESLYKEYFERIISNSSDVRADIMGYDNPNKIPLFNLLIDLVSDNISLLEMEKNEYAVYQKEQSKELLRWLETFLPKGMLAIDKSVRQEYFSALKQYFTPQDQFKNFIFNRNFTVINFNGYVSQLAGIFLTIYRNEDLIKLSWKETAKYISYKFRAKGNQINKNTIEDYLTGRKTMSRKNEIEIKI